MKHCDFNVATVHILEKMTNSVVSFLIQGFKIGGNKFIPNSGGNVTACVDKETYKEIVKCDFNVEVNY